MSFYYKLKSRQDTLAEALGLKGEAFPQNLLIGNQALTVGQVEATLVSLRSGDVVTNIYLSVNANGANLTLTKAGIYDTSGNRLSVSADVSSSFTAGSVARKQVVALTSPYTVTADGGYYLAFVAYGTSTPTAPTLSFGAQVSAAFKAIGANPRAVAQVASQTDLPASLTFTEVGTQRAYWFGWA